VFVRRVIRSTFRNPEAHAQPLSCSLGAHVLSAFPAPECIVCLPQASNFLGARMGKSHRSRRFPHFFLGKSRLRPRISHFPSWEYLLAFSDMQLSERSGPCNKFWLALAILGAVLGVLFFRSFLPGIAHFCNDAPLGALKADYIQAWPALKGIWVDIYWLGSNPGNFPLDINSLLLMVLGPIGFSKFYPHFPCSFSDFAPGAYSASEALSSALHYCGLGHHPKHEYLLECMLGSREPRHLPSVGYSSPWLGYIAHPRACFGSAFLWLDLRWECPL